MSISPGATFVVANDDPVEHTVSSTAGAFDSGTLAGGTAVALVAPTAPGTYEFACSIHPSMRGQLVVA